MKNILNILIALFALVAVGCENEQEFVSEVSSDRITVEANRRGIDCNGGQVTLNVTSNTYWILNVNEEAASWIEFTPKAAPAGTTEVFVTIAENVDVARVATLMFDTADGVKEEVTINQRGVDEQLSYYCETFGAEPVAEDTNINRFMDWETTGFGSKVLAYDGDLSISSTNPSTIEDSSAGNSLLFTEAGQELVIGPISIYGDEYFRFGFNACKREGAFSTEEFKMLVGDNCKDWFPFSYNVVEPAAEGWHKVVADFSLKKDIATEIYLKITAPAGYEIDDIVLVQGYKEDAAPMARVSMDSNPIGTVFFEENFDWITPSFSTSIDADIPFADGWSVTYLGQLSTYCSAENIALWNNSGFTYKDRVYIHVTPECGGGIRLGRASNKDPHLGCLYFPTNAVSRIDNDAAISVSFSLDIARINTSDNATVYVVATTNGVESEQEVGFSNITKTKTFGSFELTFENVTNQTTFRVETRERNGLATRIALDNFKITKL